jgi:uracil-DNA glycosylase
MIKIEPEWVVALDDYCKKPEFSRLVNFVSQEYLSKTVYPSSENIFKAFKVTPFSKVKVVILGQDPYHNPGQANGLCFSVPNGMPLPPSLRNIYKEIEVDCGCSKQECGGDLSGWADQGIFLLNAILSVIDNKPASHSNIGWEQFTDQVIKKLSDKKERLVFMLWGNYARSKKTLINNKKHLILEAPHPSPFSAYKGFFGCRHFSLCNNQLEKWGLKKINW